jgi:hypothetical protein
VAETGAWKVVPGECIPLAEMERMTKLQHAVEGNGQEDQLGNGSGDHKPRIYVWPQKKRKMVSDSEFAGSPTGNAAEDGFHFLRLAPISDTSWIDGRHPARPNRW